MIRLAILLLPHAFRLAIRPLPYGVIALGGLMVLGSMATLVDDVETAPTRVSIDQVEKGAAPDVQWWTVDDGLLWVDGAAFEVRATDDGEEVGKRRYCFAVVSESTARTWTQASLAGARPPLDESKLLVVLSEEQVDDISPNIATGTTDEFAIPLSVSGLRNSAETFSERFQDIIYGPSPSADLAEISVVEHGSEPLHKSEASVMLVFALAAIAGGALWVRRRRRRRARRELYTGNVQDLVAGAERGLGLGIQAGVRKAVAKVNTSA